MKETSAFKIYSKERYGNKTYTCWMRFTHMLSSNWLPAGHMLLKRG